MHRTSLFLTEELETGLKALKERYGTPEAESIRRAITAYLRDHGVLSDLVFAAEAASLPASAFCHLRATELQRVVVSSGSSRYTSSRVWR